jgi:hypothetical protein
MWEEWWHTGRPGRAVAAAALQHAPSSVWVDRRHPLPPHCTAPTAATRQPAGLPSPAADKVCKSQEKSLSLLWTLGIFTLNCGPVLMGFVLDFLGPKLTGILGGPAAS